MRASGWTRGLLVLGLGGLLIAGCAAGLSAKNETPGQHFERMMKEFAENCAKAKLKPNDRSCDRLKLKPADPLATEEGRFAHSIQIPNPVPEDSGYKPGMPSEQYFDHLCKTEAGEFIYKTVGRGAAEPQRGGHGRERSRRLRGHCGEFERAGPECGVGELHHGKRHGVGRGRRRL